MAAHTGPVRGAIVFILIVQLESAFILAAPADSASMKDVPAEIVSTRTVLEEAVNTQVVKAAVACFVAALEVAAPLMAHVEPMISAPSANAWEEVALVGMTRLHRIMAHVHLLQA